MSAGERGTAAANAARRAFRAQDVFRCPDLDVRMKKYLVRLANETANHLIQDTLEPNTKDENDDDDDDGQVDPRAAATNGLVWKKLSNIKGIQILRGYDVVLTDDGRAKDVACCLRGLSEVNASIEEFAMLFKLDTNKSVAEHGLLFNPDLLDMATLYALVQPSGDHPRRYVGIKWCLVQSPSKLFRNRDFCYLECQKEFRDAQGRRGWVRSMHSIKMPCCPSLEKTHGIVRASMYRCGLTAVESDKPGVLNVTYTVEMDLKGHFPEIFQPGFIAQRIASLASINKFLQQQRLSSSALLGDLDIPATKQKTTCHFCYRNFSTFTRKYVCRKCGECVCKHCSGDWELDVPVIGRRKVRICTVCSVDARFSHVTPPRSGRTQPSSSLPHPRQDYPPQGPRHHHHHHQRSLSFNSPSDFHHLHQKQQKQQYYEDEQRLQSFQHGRHTPSSRQNRRQSQPDHHQYQQPHFQHHESEQVHKEFQPTHEYRGTSDMLDFEEYTMDGMGNVRATTDLTGMWDPREEGLPIPMESPASYFGIKRHSSAMPQQRSSQQVGPSRDSILFQQTAYEEPPQDSYSEHHQSDFDQYQQLRRHTTSSSAQQQQYSQHHEPQFPYFGYQEPQQQQQQQRRRQQSYPFAAEYNLHQERAVENFPQQRHRQQSDSEMYFPPSKVNGSSRNFALEFFNEQYKNSNKHRSSSDRASERSRPQPHPFLQSTAPQHQSSRPSSQHSFQTTRSSARVQAQHPPDPPTSPNPTTQTPGEVVEFVETANGEWVEQRRTVDFPKSERNADVGRSFSHADSEDEESIHLNPGYCIYCGSKRVVRNGVIEASCICELTKPQVLDHKASTSSSSGSLQLEGSLYVQSPENQKGAGSVGVSGERIHAAADADQVIPLLVERMSQQTLRPHQRKTHSSYSE